MVVNTVTKGILTWIQIITVTLLPTPAVTDATGDGPCAYKTLSI